jgi:hypothetical protein
MTRKPIIRALFEVFQNRNECFGNQLLFVAHTKTNKCMASLVGDDKGWCSKDELVKTLRNLADHIEKMD